MLKNILPSNFNRSLDFLNLDNLYEIRLRVNAPTIINYKGRFFLGESGIAEKEENALKATQKDLETIVFNACEKSIYAHNEELKQGFITLSNGARLGICGEIVVDENGIKTIKNFSSLNIRLPHEIKNCSLKALPYLHNEYGVLNTLILAPVASGKTTFVRDLCVNISDKFIACNTLVVDERNEIGAVLNGKTTLNVGKYTDIYAGCSKIFGIVNGIRTMSPDVIVLDELANESDIDSVIFASGTGVKIIATTHCEDYEALFKKPNFRKILDLQLFERFVVLSKRKGEGTLEGIWDKSGKCIFLGEI